MKLARVVVVLALVSVPLAACGDVAQKAFPEGENAELDKDLQAYGFQVCGSND